MQPSMIRCGWLDVRRNALLVLIVLLVAGCRTVWMHPDATPEKFAKEQAECIRMSLDAGVTRAQCMYERGWTRRTAFRGAARVQVTSEP